MLIDVHAHYSPRAYTHTMMTTAIRSASRTIWSRSHAARHLCWVALLSLALIGAFACSSASLPTETFTAQDYGFRGPASIQAGMTRIRLVNHGQHAHMLGLVALTGDKTIADFIADVKKSSDGSFPSYASWAGGPDAVDPDGASTALLDLAPGAYVVVCTMPDDDTGHSHLDRGMYQGLTITNSGQGAHAPEATTVVTQTDFRFATEGEIRAGEQTIRVQNKGRQDHEVQLARLPNDVTVDQYIALGDATSPTAGSSYGGLAPITPSKDGFFTAAFTPGRYAFICFVTDPQSGKAHFQLGMISEFTVK